MKLKNPTPLFLLFLLIPLTQAIYAGSTITLPISFKNATIEFYCVDKIDANEFALPCNSTILNNTYQKFVCGEMNKLEISINPASNNSCDVFITYWQSITMPSSTTYFRTETTVLKPIENKTIINRTIIQPYKEVVREVTKTVYYENTTKIQQYEEMLNAYKKQLEEAEFRNKLYFTIAMASLIILFIISLKYVVDKHG